MKKAEILKRILGFIIPLLLVILWIVLSESGKFSVLILPKVSTIAEALSESITSGMMLDDLRISFFIVIRGYFIGAVLGFVLGVIMGVSQIASGLLAPMFNVIRQIPPLAWIPILILWVGIGDDAKIILIALAVFFPVLLNTINGISEVPGSYLEFAKNYGIKKKDVLLKILLPGAVPSIFIGLRLGAGTAWMSIVAAEMIASVAGVGYRINAARNMMETATVIVYMILIGLIGGLMDIILRKLGEKSVKWRRE